MQATAGATVTTVASHGCVASLTALLEASWRRAEIEVDKHGHGPVSQRPMRSERRTPRPPLLRAICEPSHSRDIRAISTNRSFQLEDDAFVLKCFAHHRRVSPALKH